MACLTAASCVTYLNKNHLATGVFDFLLGALTGLGIDINYGHLRAFFDELQRADFGDTCAATGQEGGFSCESWHSHLN